MPEQKSGPELVTMTTRASSSPATSCSAALMRATIAFVSAFLRSGRLSVSVRTPLAQSTRSSLSLVAVSMIGLLGGRRRGSGLTGAQLDEEALGVGHGRTGRVLQPAGDPSFPAGDALHLGLELVLDADAGDVPVVHGQVGGPGDRSVARVGEPAEHLVE